MRGVEVCRWSRLGRWFAVAMLAAVGGCGASADPSPPAARLVFELGGDAAPIAAALQRRAAPQDAAPVAVPKPDPAALGGLPAPTRIAILGQGETLGALCARELGTSTRWREVAELNGFSERELNALPTGTRVRLPLR